MFGEAWKRRLLNKVGLIVEAKAKELCPTDTGMLRSSIHVSKVDTKSMTVTISVPVEHAWYMEHGRRPGKVPFKPIEKWARRHNLPAFPVWWSIKKRGIKAGTPRSPFKTPSGYRPFLESALYQSKNKIRNLIIREIREGLRINTR